MPTAYVDEVIEIIRNDPRKHDTAMQVANLLWWGAGVNSKNIPRPTQAEIAEVLELAKAIDNPGLIAMFEDEREILNEWQASGKEGTPPNKRWDNVRLGELLEFARMNPQRAGPQSAAEQAQVIRDVDAFVAKLEEKREAKRRGQAVQGMATMSKSVFGDKLNQDVEGKIGSFLTNVDKPLEQQLPTLKKQANKGGRRKTKTSKKKSRRTRRR
jgi:hypothetical protein